MERFVLNAAMTVVVGSAIAIAMHGKPAMAATYLVAAIMVRMLHRYAHA